MIHNRADYMHIQDPSGKIGEDEPVFMVRCKDQLAPGTVRIWAQLYGIINDENNSDTQVIIEQLVNSLKNYNHDNCTMTDDVKTVVESVMKFADGMDEWQKTNHNQPPSVPTDTI